MPEAKNDGQLFAVVLVGTEEGAVEILLIRAMSAEHAILAALHNPRWEGYACPVALDVDEVEYLSDLLQLQNRSD